MSEVTTGFIMPIQGVSQVDPLVRPFEYVAEQINMVSDKTKGLIRRPGVKFRRKKAYDLIFTKYVGYNEDTLEITLFKNTLDTSWQYEIYNIDSEATTAGVISDDSINAYLNTITDARDLDIKLFRDNLYIISRKSPLNILSDTSTIIIQFKQETDKLEGNPGTFEATIDDVLYTITSSESSEIPKKVLYSYLEAFKTQLGAKIEFIYFDEIYAVLMINLKQGTKIENIRYIENTTYANPLKLESIIVREDELSFAGTSLPVIYDLVYNKFTRFAFDLGQDHSMEAFIREHIDNQPIRDFTFVNNRFIYITNTALIGSKLNRYNQFQLQDNQNLTILDPVFLSIAQPGDSLDYLLSSNNGLLVFGKYKQYLVSTNGQINASAVSFQISNYTIEEARPIRNTSQVYFAESDGLYSKIFVMDTQSFATLNLTQNIQKYIPVNISKLGYVGSRDMLIVFSEQEKQTLYIANFDIVGNQFNQLAWHKWTFPYEIDDFEVMSNDQISIMFKETTTRYYGIIDFEQRKFFLDLWSTLDTDISNPNKVYITYDGTNWFESANTSFTYTGIPFESKVVLSPIIFKDQNGNPLLQGRQTLSELVLGFRDSWYLKIIQETKGREPNIKEFQNLELDGRSELGLITDFDILDEIEEAAGVFHFHIRGSTATSRITITSDLSVWSMGIVGYIFFGNWEPYNKWLQPHIS